MPLTIAITGACGLVGKGVVSAALAAGHTVLALDLAASPPPDLARAAFGNPSQFTYKQVQLTDHDAFLAAVKAGNCNALVHLAATYSLQNPKDPEGPLLRAVPDHVVHNTNTSMSWNALSVAAALGIERVSLASSVNAIGLIFSKRPRFDYLPLDEKHACYPEDAYSVCKVALEKQADAFARKYPRMRIASIRPHWVIPESLACDPVALDAEGGTAKDLWGWVSLGATARAFLLGLTAPVESFPLGHEAFFAVAPTMALKQNSMEVIRKAYPEVSEFKKELVGNSGFFDCSKAERMLGWSERGFLWTGN